LAALGLLMSYGSYKFSKKMIADNQGKQKQPELQPRKKLVLEEVKEEVKKQKSTT
jgi:hypothetical protein